MSSNRECRTVLQMPSGLQPSPVSHDLQAQQGAQVQMVPTQAETLQSSASPAQQLSALQGSASPAQQAPALHNTPPMPSAVLQAHKIVFRYHRDVPLLESISTSIIPGSFLAVLGINGCGKSTLLACLDALLAPSKGAVLLNGVPLKTMKREERAQLIGFVAQHSHANRLTVYDALLLGRKPFIKSAPTQEDMDIVDEVLDEMEMRDYALRYVDELSGGEYQKVMLARAFVQKTDILLLDEPTNNLDPANQNEVMSIIAHAVRERGLAAVAVMHDINLALRYCDAFLLMKDGYVAAWGGTEVMTQERIQEIYGLEVDIIEHAGRKVVIAR